MPRGADAGYKGRDCSARTKCLASCEAHGVCVSDGVCECNPGWSGKGCEIAAACPANCSGFGECHAGKCFCRAGHSGRACQHAPVCPDKCSGRGLCKRGKCFCDAGWTGEGCAVKAACLPDANCSGHGACEPSGCAASFSRKASTCDATRSRANAGSFAVELATSTTSRNFFTYVSTVWIGGAETDPCRLDNT